MWAAGETFSVLAFLYIIQPLLLRMYVEAYETLSQYALFCRVFNHSLCIISVKAEMAEE